MKIRSVISLSCGTEEYRRPLVNHPKRRDLVMVDFDGVLADSKGPYDPRYIGLPIPEGLKLLGMLKAKGYEIAVLTARTSTDLVANWLKQHGFPNTFVTNHKLPAVAYVDDRAATANDGFTAEGMMRQISKNPGAK